MKLDEKKVALAKAHIEAFNTKYPEFCLELGSQMYAKRFVALYNAYVTLEESMNIYKKMLRKRLHPKPWPRKKAKRFHQMRVGG